MTVRIWTGRGEFVLSHERRALWTLVSETLTRFGEADELYALFVDFTVQGEKVDLLALTPRAIIVIDLKDVQEPGGVIHGTENGPWRVEFPDGSEHELNEGRLNPYQQVSRYRDALSDWLNLKGDAILGAQRKSQLELRQVGAWVAVTPGIREKETWLALSFLPAFVRKWFRVMSLESFYQELYSAAAPGIHLDPEDVEAIAGALGVHERQSLFGMVLPQRREIPNPQIFGSPRVIRFSLDRKTELEQLIAAVVGPAHSVIFIGGQGGVGKTHLASALCEQLVGRARIYWLACGEAGGREMTLETLLLAFARELPDATRAQIVADPYQREGVRLDIILQFLEEQGACLVFDDYHLLGADAGIDRFIRRLDRSCRKAKVVLTARQRPAFLDDGQAPVEGYWELPVAGLGPTDTLAYLREQVQKHRLRISDADAVIVWERTRGVPYVLNILAQISAGQSPAEVAQTLAIVSDERADQWFRALMQPISQRARRVADALSVMRGPIPEDTVLALAGQPDAMASVNELVDHFVLLVDPEARLYTFSGALRDYLHENINPVTRGKYHGTAARTLLGRAKDLKDGYEQAHVYLEALSHAYQAEQWSTLLRYAVAPVEQFKRWGEWSKARRLCEWTVMAAEKVGKAVDEAYWRLELARQLRHLGLYAEAAKQCEQGRVLAEKSKDRSLCAKAYHQMAMLADRRHDLVEARRWQECALAAERVLGDKAHIARALGKLGDYDRMEGRYTEALQRYQESLKLSEELGEARSLGITCTQIGTLEKYCGNLEAAREHMERSLRYARSEGLPIGMAIALGQLADIAARQGAYVEALRLIEQSGRLIQDVPDDYSRKVSDGIHVDILIEAGRVAEAEERLQRLEKGCREESDIVGWAFNRKRRGLLMIRGGELKTGAQMVEEAIRVLDAKGLRYYALDCRETLRRTLARGEQPRLPFDELMDDGDGGAQPRLPFDE